MQIFQPNNTDQDRVLLVFPGNIIVKMTIGELLEPQSVTEMLTSVRNAMKESLVKQGVLSEDHIDQK